MAIISNSKIVWFRPQNFHDVFIELCLLDLKAKPSVVTCVWGFCLCIFNLYYTCKSYQLVSYSNNQFSHRVLQEDIKHCLHLYANIIHSEMGTASVLTFDLRIGLTFNLGEKQTKWSLATDNITERRHLEKLPASNVSQGMGSTPIFTLGSF